LQTHLELTAHDPLIKTYLFANQSGPPNIAHREAPQLLLTVPGTRSDRRRIPLQTHLELTAHDPPIKTYLKDLQL
jgi:hypothetical protein